MHILCVGSEACTSGTIQLSRFTYQRLRSELPYLIRFATDGVPFTTYLFLLMYVHFGQMLLSSWGHLLLLNACNVMTPDLRRVVKQLWSCLNSVLVLFSCYWLFWDLFCTVIYIRNLLMAQYLDSNIDVECSLV